MELHFAIVDVENLDSLDVKAKNLPQMSIIFAHLSNLGYAIFNRADNVMSPFGDSSEFSFLRVEGTHHSSVHRQGKIDVIPLGWIRHPYIMMRALHARDSICSCGLVDVLQSLACNFTEENNLSFWVFFILIAISCCALKFNDGYFTPTKLYTTGSCDPGADQSKSIQHGCMLWYASAVHFWWLVVCLAEHSQKSLCVVKI